MFFVVLSDLALKFRAAKIALKSDVFQTLLLSVLLEELVWTEVPSCVMGCYCSVETVSQFRSRRVSH